MAEQERPDIFELAAANDDAVRADAIAAVTAAEGTEKSCLEDFIGFVRSNWGVSINMRLHVATKFLQGGVYENIHLYCRRMAKVSGRDSEEVLAEKLGKWFPQRLAFESHFASPNGFSYGAVNVGGAGPSRYAPYCLVFPAEALGFEGQPAFLRGDSLVDYNGTDNMPELAKVVSELSSAATVPESAVLKHLDTVTHVPPETWPSLVCSDSGYIEAIFNRPLEPSMISEVRATASELDELWDLAFADFDRKLTPAEAALVDDFAQLLEITAAGSPALRRV